MPRSFFKIFSGPLLISLAIVALTAINHPIILKWVTGSARIIGKPINATVYTNGQINHGIKVYHVDKYWNGKDADYYILYAANAADNSKLKFFSLNRKDNYAGRPSATTADLLESDQ